MKIEHYAHIDDNGNLNLSNRRRFKDDLKHLKGCDVEVIVKRRGRRSSQMNKYYWGCLIREITDFLIEKGYDIDTQQVHEMCKYKFNKQYIMEDDLVLGEYGGSTTEMNNEEMGVYMDKIIRWAAEDLELIISQPNEQTTLQL